MTTWVVDASVAVKWALPGQDGATHQEHALALLTDIQQGKGQVLQPPHWLAEVGAVLTRLAPQQSISMIQTFLAMELPMTTEWNVYDQACRLAVELNQHLSDTLYHAVALHVPDTLFITATPSIFEKQPSWGTSSS